MAPELSPQASQSLTISSSAFDDDTDNKMNRIMLSVSAPAGGAETSAAPKLKLAKHFVLVLDSMIRTSPKYLALEKDDMSEIKQKNLFESQTAYKHISFPDYVNRLAIFSKCSVGAFACAVVYLCRLFQRHPHLFTFKAIHKLFGTTLVISIKFWDDHHFPNTFYASILGITAHDLNELQHALFQLLGHNLFVSTEEFNHILKLVHFDRVPPL